MLSRNTPKRLGNSIARIFCLLSPKATKITTIVNGLHIEGVPYRAVAAIDAADRAVG
ncbi:hypothetical protein [Halocatena marina]|uniref:hypothetical protein n=1 Tax=Halocatena marina TaxID=2934937 RepID=UPI00200D51BC|nr:hypothetical protein [Halocatena marina]